MANLDWTTDYGRLKDIPLFIESVFEDLALKRKILAAVQEVNPDAIFASNTSTIPMADISSEAKGPDKVVGMHFFSPVPLMPLLEVVEGPGSSRQAVATAITAGKAMGKTVIAVGDGPGFYTSRTFGRYVLSGFTLAELGMDPWEVDLLAMKAGFPQGPLHIYGTAGGNVIYHAAGFMSDRLSDRFELPRSIVNMYNAGYVGAGQPCFYLDERKMTRNEAALNFIASSNGGAASQRNGSGGYSASGNGQRGLLVPERRGSEGLLQHGYRRGPWDRVPGLLAWPGSLRKPQGSAGNQGQTR